MPINRNIILTAVWIPEFCTIICIICFICICMLNRSWCVITPTVPAGTLASLLISLCAYRPTNITTLPHLLCLFLCLYLCLFLFLYLCAYRPTNIVTCPHLCPIPVPHLIPSLKLFLPLKGSFIDDMKKQKEKKPA